MNDNNKNEIEVRSRGGLVYSSFQEGLKKYNPQEQDLVSWLWGYYHSADGNRDKETLCRELGGYDWEKEVRPVFSGYCLKGIHDELFAAIASLKKRVSKRKPLIKTIVTERIIQALDYVRDNAAMIYISGPTGRGKTYTSQWWAAENNHGRSVYYRCPSDCSRRQLVNDLCRLRGVSHSRSCGECEVNLRLTLTPRNVLILDEAGHLLSRSGRPGGAIELVRDLHDMTGCAIALIFTDVYLKEIKNGARSDYFEQFLGRLEFPVEIPAQPRRDEVRQALSAYYDEIDEDLVSYALKLSRDGDGQLRTLYHDLTRAEEFALSKGRKILPEDLKLFAKWRKSSGAWPEDR